MLCKALLFGIGLAVGLGLPAAARADSFTAPAANGYVRLLFTLAPAGHATAEVSGTVLTITFDRKIDVAPATIAQAAPQFIQNGRSDPDGKAYRFALSQTARVHLSAATDKIAVDLLPASYAGTPPDLPQPPPPAPKAVDVAKLDLLKVRVGSYRKYTRVVFDWPRHVPYTVFPGARKLTIRFDALARPDFTAMTREAPPWVRAAGWRIDNKGTVIELDTDAASGFHDFRDGTHVVIDVLAPHTDADAYAPPGMGKPGMTPFSPAKPDKRTAVVTPAQVQAIADAAATLNKTDKPAQAPKPAPAAPAAPPPAPPADTAAAPAAGDAAAAPPPDTNPVPQAAGGAVTRNGVVLSFPGAGRRGSAVFIRGLTAWVVLQGAPPLDAAKLKSELGTFPEAVEAASGDEVSVLRLSLKQAEQIAATAEGSTLKVAIAPQVTNAATEIGFARNQDDPRHSSLSTLLPGATKPVALVDPIAGDEITVVPGAAGRDIPDERRYVEFSVLPSASGLVLAPYVDDLSVSVDQTRVTITRTGGLSLTEPTLSAASIPEALTGSGEGPCFLDLARWRRITGGTFLATERRLRAATARLATKDANRARLALARFYLANQFAAETLGLVDVMQQADPSLQSDMHLQTIKAAASYAMGRYRDAHNALAAAQFDGDRHAALWRGLNEAAQEDWQGAHADLERAMPVLDRYEPDMRALVRLANAEAALGVGRLEIADAQLTRLPKTISRHLELEAALDRARLYAAEHRKTLADLEFAAVATSGDEALAAQTVYYRVEASLAAGTMSRASAINALERLRFRWRGDILEMKTLRKLASLYFAQKRWRDGLQRLRIASSNFPNEDLAGKAQDDMRDAFVDLFLKGKADAMPPVEALGLFYDFIDLTPIGPDGDEMIRRMADRLVAVDLLAPAADLLNYQITKRLDGVARAQVATRLAMVQLMDHKPQAAIETLRTTRISTLPDEISHQRLLLEARALSQEKLWDQALDLIGVDQAPDTLRLKSDIYWDSGNWSVAGHAAEDSLGARWSDGMPLTATERQEVVRAAVAYSLANDETSLERLRGRFADKMKATPDVRVFAVVTGRIDMQGMAFRAAAAQVAAVDTLTAFMKDLQAHPIGRD